MTDTKARLAGRTPSPILQVVTVFRNRLHLPYHEMMEQLESKSEKYAVFNVLAVLHDISACGMGLSFEGQQTRAHNLIRPGEHYILQLSLMLNQIPEDLAPYLRTVSPHQYLLVRAVCRWEQVTAGVSRVGFELLDSNPPEVLRFLSERLGAGSPTAR